MAGISKKTFTDLVDTEQLSKFDYNQDKQIKFFKENLFAHFAKWAESQAPETPQQKPIHVRLPAITVIPENGSFKIEIDKGSLSSNNIIGIDTELGPIPCLG